MPHSPSPRRAALALALLAVVLMASLATWVERGRTVVVNEPAAARLPCLSYAPFRRAGHTPFDAALVVTPQQIEADLRLLVPRTRCVRLYGTGHGLTAVPAIARRLGLRVVLGAWLGREEAANAAEVERAVALARAHADVVDRLIVGNEVLLRRELDVPALARWLDHARARVSVPVSYADVWEFWLRHDRLRAHVDIVTAHVLPYWEDDPVAIDDAVAHVYAQARKLQSHFAPLPVWVGETGWPAAGRQRAAAAPGRMAQARFVRELVARAEKEALDFNFIEAFDQPWKGALEGQVGGAWGLFDAQGVERVTWRGALREDAHWWRGPLAALIGLVIGLSTGCLIGTPRASRRTTAIAAAAAGLGGALISALGLQTLLGPLADARAGIVAFGFAQMPLLWSLALLAAAAVLVVGLPATLSGSMAVARQVNTALAWAVLVALFAAGCLVLPIIADPRYRALPWAPLWAAAGPLLAQRLLAPLPERLRRQQQVLGTLLLCGAPALMLREGALNAQAWAVAAALVAMATAALWPGSSAGATRGDHPASFVSRGPGRAGTNTAISASKTAGAARSAE